MYITNEVRCKKQPPRVHNRGPNPHQHGRARIGAIQPDTTSCQVAQQWPKILSKMARRINFSWRMSVIHIRLIEKTSLLIERNKHIIAILNKYRLMVTSSTSEASLTFPFSTPSILIVLLKFLPVRLKFWPCAQKFTPCSTGAPKAKNNLWALQTEHSFA